MKKYISLILCIILTLSLVHSNTAPVKASSDQSSSSAIDILSNLNFVPEDFKENSKITRENFVVFLISAMGLGGVSNNKALPFSDVSPDMTSYSALTVAYDLGIIHGNGNVFQPKSPVSLYQAIKMTVSALGYGQLAEAKGGYPAGYLQTANSLDLLDGILKAADESLNGNEAAQLLYNALNSTVLQVAEIGNGTVSYSDTSGKTMLEVYHGIIPFEGQLRATKSCVISGNHELSGNQVIIGDTLYKTNGANFDMFAGYTVRAYYSKNKDLIVAMEKSEAVNKTLVISADDILGFSNGYLAYNEKDKDKKTAISATCDIVYNGRPATDVNSELFSLDDGDVTLIDSNGDGTYDTIIISDFVNYVVSAVAPDEKIIYDLYDSSKVLKIGETDEIFVDDFGNIMYFEELKKYDVISVWKSTDGKNIRMKFSNKEIRGTLTEINKSDNSVVVNGVTLNFAKNFIEAGSYPELGASGIFALDASGKIAAFNPSDGKWEYAYLISTSTGNSSLDKKFMIRVFTMQGDIIILDCDPDKLLIDGDYKTPDEAKAYFSKSQLIRYETNGAGMVVMIDTSASGTGDDDLLQQTHTAYNENYAVVDANRLRWSKDGKLFSGKVPVASDVKVLNVPHPGSVWGDDEYYLTSISEFQSASYVSFESYKTGNETVVSDVLIRYNLSGGGASIATKTPITVVDEVKSALNKDGDATIKLSAWYNGSTYREYFFEDEELYKGIVDSQGQPYTLKKGDIVRLAINENSGAVKKLELVYSREKDDLPKGAQIGSGEYFVSERFVKGRVYEKEDNYISLTQTDLISGVEPGNDQKEFHVLYSNKILVYDSSVRGGELRSGTINDVRDFKTFGGECSKVVIFTVDGGDISIVVVYK